MSPQMFSQRLFPTLVTVLTLLNSACGGMGGLRPAWEDEMSPEPTTGGRFANGGLLEDAPSKALRAGKRDSYSDSLTNDDTGEPLVAESRPSRNTRDVRRDLAKRERPSEIMRQRRLSKRDFIDDSSSDGSLWDSDGQTNYFLTKNKVRNPGDFVTIVTDPEIIRDFAYELKRSLTEDERDEALELAKNKPLASASDGEDKASEKGTDKEVAATKDGEKPAAAATLSKDSKNVRWSDVDLREFMEFKPGDPVVAEVISRQNNGTYRLEGVKRVRYRNTYRTIAVSAIVKQADISENDEVPSTKLFEYRLETLE